MLDSPAEISANSGPPAEAGADVVKADAKLGWGVSAAISLAAILIGVVTGVGFVFAEDHVVIVGISICGVTAVVAEGWLLRLARNKAERDHANNNPEQKLADRNVCRRWYATQLERNRSYGERRGQHECSSVVQGASRDCAHESARGVGATGGDVKGGGL